ncbi:MAG: DUF488 domain-containing protein [Parvularculaceae bacterium]
MISTIGYEGVSLEEFIATLKVARVDIVIDVRERAQSRRKGFSKNALADALEVAGIEYEHFPELGDPKEGRDAARSGDIGAFQRIYSQRIKQKDALAAIDEIIDISISSHACLLCFERNPNVCHRKLITDVLEKKNQIKATHLGVRKNESLKPIKRRVLHTRESVAPSVG